MVRFRLFHCLTFALLAMAMSLPAASAGGSDHSSRYGPEDPDGDGLSNDDEAYYGTYPYNPYSDADSKNDGDDGWALDSNLSPPRIVDVSYAVIDLHEYGIDAVTDLNAKGEVLGWFNDGSFTGCSVLWKAGEVTSLPRIEGEYHQIAWSGINDSTVISGVNLQVDTQNPEGDGTTKGILLTWSEEGGVHLEHEDYFPPDVDLVSHYMSWEGALITADGTLYATIWGECGNDSPGVNRTHFGGSVKVSAGTVTELSFMKEKRTGTILTSLTPPVPGSVIGMDPIESVNSAGIVLGLTRNPYSENTEVKYEWKGSGVFDAGEVKLLKDMDGSGASCFATALSEGSAPFVAGTSDSDMAIWSKRPTWKRIYSPSDQPGSGIQGIPSAINSKAEIVGSNFSSAKTGKTGQLVRNGAVFDLKKLVSNSYTIDSADIINEAGIICGTGRKLGQGEAHSLMLLPIEFFDSKDITLDNANDVSITPKKDANDKSLSSVAWIAPHGAANGKDPAMPYLVLRCPGTDQMNLKIKWKLKVEYKRPSGRTLAEDTVTIQSGGQTWAPETFNGALKFYDNADWKTAIGNQSDALQAGRGFFGGNATLTWQLMKSDGSPLIDQQTILFRIAGKNPDDATCRQYIDKVANDMLSQSQTLMWYAYAIAKSETKDEGGEQYYNQFLKRGDKYRDKKGSEGVPDWNNDGKGKPGGYGVKQVTGYKGNENGDVPRSVIWNWEHNVDEGMRELAKINKEARSWMQRQRSAATKTLPPHTVRSVVFSDGTPHTMEDAVAIKRYNGASRRPQPDTYSDPGTGGFSYANEVPRVGHYCYWDKGRDKWSLSRYNNFNGGFNYVDRVCQEVEP